VSIRVPLAPGDALTLRFSTRIGTNATGAKCAGHNSATGLRLYYDGSTRPSGVDAHILPTALTTYFLRTVGPIHVLDVQAPSGTAQFKDSSAVNFSGGNLWRTIAESPDGGADLQVGPQPAGLKTGRSIRPSQFRNVLLVRLGNGC
jgi:hypothetical protein